MVSRLKHNYFVDSFVNIPLKKFGSIVPGTFRMTFANYLDGLVKGCKGTRCLSPVDPACSAVFSNFATVCGTHHKLVQLADVPREKLCCMPVDFITLSMPLVCLQLSCVLIDKWDDLTTLLLMLFLLLLLLEAVAVVDVVLLGVGIRKTLLRKISGIN
jgi:hypothetical protein